MILFIKFLLHANVDCKMGFKRPFDDEKFHELPFKHSRQLGFNDKSTQFQEFIPRHAVSEKPLATGKYS